jgi:hypothetical protein
MSYLPETASAKLVLANTNMQYSAGVQFLRNNDAYFYSDSTYSQPARINGVKKIKVAVSLQSAQPGSGELLYDGSMSNSSMVNPIDYTSRFSAWRTSTTLFGGRSDSRVAEAVYSTKNSTFNALAGTTPTRNIQIGTTYSAIGMIPVGDNV